MASRTGDAYRIPITEFNKQELPNSAAFNLRKPFNKIPNPITYVKPKKRKTFRMPNIATIGGKHKKRVRFTRRNK